MPPRFRFTREEITAAALTITRQHGLPGLTARALATALGSSAKPIFGLFENMEEVHAAVREAAYALYQSYLQRWMADPAILPYKASGLAYIQFARDERELFKLLFMCDRTGQTIGEDRASVRPLLEIIMKNLHITEDEAYLLHMENWIYVHGIATMAATGFLNWDMAFISQSVTDVYQGLTRKFKEDPACPPSASKA